MRVQQWSLVDPPSACLTDTLSVNSTATRSTTCPLFQLPSTGRHLPGLPPHRKLCSTLLCPAAPAVPALQDATSLAFRLIANYGLSPLGVTTWAPAPRRSNALKERSFEVTGAVWLCSGAQVCLH